MLFPTFDFLLFIIPVLLLSWAFSHAQAIRIPLLIGAVRATGASLGLEAGTGPWMLLLMVFAVWATLAAVLLFPTAAEQ